MQRNIATIISRIFEPLVLLVVMAVLAGVKAGLRGSTLFWYLFIVLFGMVGPVAGFWMWFVAAKKLDWDIKDRKKRIVPLAVLVGLTVLDYFLISLWGNRVLSSIFQLFIVWIVGFFLITTRWKISGHAGVAALATGLTIVWFGWAWWPVLLIVPLVGWARVVRRDHTVFQVIAGALYSWILVQLVKLV